MDRLKHIKNRLTLTKHKLSKIGIFEIIDEANILLHIRDYGEK